MIPEPERCGLGPSDADRMLALRRGDLGAFEQLVDRYREPLYAYFLRMVGDRGWAEDLCQETFLRVYRNRGNYEERDEFKAWVFRIARNLAFDFKRREKHRSRRTRTIARTPDAPENPLAELPCADPPPADQIGARELEERVQMALSELPLKFRNVFVLCVLEGLSYEEAAAIENCPVKTISSRLARARQRFAGSLETYLQS